VSVTHNSKCVGLGIPRRHCVQGAAGTRVCCSKHSRERDCQQSRAWRQATTHHSHRGDTAGQVPPDAFCTFAGTQMHKHSPVDTRKGPVRGFPICNSRLPSPPRPIIRAKPPACLLHQDKPALGPARDAHCRSVQSSCPQVCPFAPKWMGLIQVNTWWSSRAARGYSSL